MDDDDDDVADDTVLLPPSPPVIATAIEVVWLDCIPQVAVDAAADDNRSTMMTSFATDDDGDDLATALAGNKLSDNCIHRMAAAPRTLAHTRRNILC